MIVRPFPEEVRLVAMRVFEGGDGRSAFQHGLWELAVVEADVAQDGLFEVLAGAEAVALQDILDPAVERNRPDGTAVLRLSACCC